MVSAPPSCNVVELEIEGRMSVGDENDRKVITFKLRPRDGENATLKRIKPLLSVENGNTALLSSSFAVDDNDGMTLVFTYPSPAPKEGEIYYEVDGQIHELKRSKKTNGCEKQRTRRRNGTLPITRSGDTAIRKEVSTSEDGERLDEADALAVDPDETAQSSSVKLNEEQFSRLQQVADKLEVTLCPGTIIPDSVSCGPTTPVFLSHMKELAKLAASVQSIYTCETCGMRTSSYFSYIEHVFRHRELRPYQCTVCQSVFQTRAVVRHHLDMHGGKAPFQCEFCGKRFRNSCHMKEHRYKHTGEKPFTCSYCSRPFAHRNGLRKHLQQHTGDKPCQCDLCGKLFRDCYRLKKHLQSHKRNSNKTMQPSRNEQLGDTGTENVTFPCIDNVLAEEARDGSVFIEIPIETSPAVDVEENSMAP